MTSTSQNLVTEGSRRSQVSAFISSSYQDSVVDQRRHFIGNSDQIEKQCIVTQHKITGLCLLPKNSERKKWLDQFSSVAQLCLTLCDPINHSSPGIPVHHQLPESTQTHVHGVGDAIQPSHPMLSPSPPAFSLSQHQSLFKWVSSLHQMAKGLEFQLQHQSFQWTPRTDLL